MSDPKYKIGNLIWRALARSIEKQIECPDCAGTGRIRMIMADGSQVAIPCGNCSIGYEPPTGRIQSYEFESMAGVGTICGIRQNGEGGFEYEITAGVGGIWIMKEADIFATEEAAIARAHERKAEHTAIEADRFKGKHDGNRTWAWNASYHRRSIRFAEKELAYHRRMLETASLRAKNRDEATGISTQLGETHG